MDELGFPKQRPKSIEADVLRFQNNHERWIAVVGLIHKNPYEIYTGLADDFWLPTWVNKGEIIEEKLSDHILRYDFAFKDRQDYRIIMEGLSHSFDKGYRDPAKFISEILKENVSPEIICKFLNKMVFEEEPYKSSLNICKDGIVRVLSKYVLDKK